MPVTEERFLNYTKLLSELVDYRGRKLNETTVTFLYQLFPNDLFVKAFSLLEANHLFLYVWDPDHHDESTAVCPKSTNSSTASNVGNDHEKVLDSSSPRQDYNKNAVTRLTKMMYSSERKCKPLNRIIVQSGDQDECRQPVYVDLASWFCSCKDCTHCFSDLLYPEESKDSLPHSSLEPLSDVFESYETETGDDFGRLNDFTHINTNKIICQHLLAAAILLQTSLKVLSYFTSVKQSVSVLRVTNKDDWLKLHLNIVE